VKTLLALGVIFVGSSLIMVVVAFVADGRQEAARTGLQLLTLAVSVLLISFVLLLGSGAIGFSLGVLLVGP
jgi:hypothetical protein